MGGSVPSVRRFAAALSQHPEAADAVGETAGAVLEALGGRAPDLLVCFASEHFVTTFGDVVATVRDLVAPRVLVGGTAGAVIGGPREVEGTPGLSLFAAVLPEAVLQPLALHSIEVPDGAAIVGWPEVLEDPSALLLFADPFTFPVGVFLERIEEMQPGLPVIGGLASAGRGPGGNRLAVDGSVLEEGAVGVVLSGVAVQTVVSQGCRPIGHPYVVTGSERNLLVELAGKPALAQLQRLAADATDDERELLTTGLHVGVVVDEHKAEFGRGDFLVRNVLGADERSGAIAVGEQVSVGQTVQFHVRDADAADEDLRELLAGVDAEAAILFTCNGRGRNLFGVPDHDAELVARLLGPIPAAGAFCAGEIGPVGNRNFLHGFTASLALFS